MISRVPSEAGELSGTRMALDHPNGETQAAGIFLPLDILTHQNQN